VLAAHPLRLTLGLAQDWGARADRVNSDLFLDLGWTRGLDLTFRPTSSFFSLISDEPSCLVRLIHCNRMGYDGPIGRTSTIVTKGRIFMWIFWCYSATCICSCPHTSSPRNTRMRPIDSD
jgi:hypothetical protein